jgi:hypothetical protein
MFSDSLICKYTVREYTVRSVCLRFVKLTTGNCSYLLEQCAISMGFDFSMRQTEHILLIFLMKTKFTAL